MFCLDKKITLTINLFTDWTNLFNTDDDKLFLLATKLYYRFSYNLIIKPLSLQIVFYCFKDHMT